MNDLLAAAVAYIIVCIVFYACIIKGAGGRSLPTENADKQKPKELSWIDASSPNETNPI